MIRFRSRRDAERRISLLVEKWEDRKAIDEGDRMKAAGMTNAEIREVFQKRERFQEIMRERLSLDALPECEE